MDHPNPNTTDVSSTEIPSGKWVCTSCKIMGDVIQSMSTNYRTNLCYKDKNVLQRVNYCTKCAPSHVHCNHDCIQCGKTDGDRVGTYSMQIDLINQNAVLLLVHCSEECLQKSVYIHSADPRIEGMFKCDFCGTVSKKLPICGKCKKVYYCNRECQQSGWKKHKEVCKKRE